MLKENKNKRFCVNISQPTIFSSNIDQMFILQCDKGIFFIKKEKKMGMKETTAFPDKGVFIFNSIHSTVIYQHTTPAQQNRAEQFNIDTWPLEQWH